MLGHTAGEEGTLAIPMPPSLEVGSMDLGRMSHSCKLTPRFPRIKVL
jgi:hypothetical protein